MSTARKPVVEDMGRDSVGHFYRLKGQNMHRSKTENERVAY